MAHVNLTPEITDIINRSTITGNTLKLPSQLDRKTYESVNKALVAAGGKWVGGKTQAHVFSEDPSKALGLALESGKVIDQKKVRQAFYTPAPIADEVALAADVSGMRVLEPSAGDGALAKACQKFGSRQVDCIEMEPKCREHLIGSGRAVMIADFLSQAPYERFDRVVMNPPFTKGQDVKHIQHALKWLKPGGKLFSIVPDKDNPKLTALGARTVKTFDQGAFKESGTMVRTRLIAIELN